MKKKIDDVTKKIKSSKLVFKINGENSYESAIKANNFLLYKYYLKLLLSIIYLGFLLPILCLLVDYNFSLDFASAVIAIFLFVFAGTVLGLIISYFIRKSKLKKIYDDLQEKGSIKYSTYFYKKGLIRKDVNSTISHLYTDFIRVDENKDFIYFYLNNKNCIFLSKKTLKPNQYAYIASVKEEISKRNNVPYEINITKKVLGIILLALLFILGVYINYKTFYSLIIGIICSFLILRVSQIIYEKYINYLNTFALILTCILSALSVFLGQYLFYVSYYYSYFVVDGYSYTNVLFNLFSLIDLNAIMSYLKYSVIVAAVTFLLDAYFIYKIISKRYILLENSDKLEPGYHVSFKHKYFLLCILTLLFFSLNVFNYKDINLNGYDNDHTIYGYSGYYLSTPLSTRYSDQINSLKDICQDAYKAAYNNVFKQTTFVDFNADNYYFSVSDDDDISVSFYANFDTDDDYCLYFEAYDYEGLVTESVWSDWYEIDGEHCYIDLNVHTSGNGYSVIVISNDFDDRLINIFIDGERNNSDIDYSYPGTICK